MANSSHERTPQGGLRSIMLRLEQLEARRGVILLTGVGAPEGRIPARQATMYVDLEGTPGAILYVKRNDDNSESGWVAV